MGVGAAMVDIALMPEIAHLIDIRHNSAYSNVYAISDIAVCLGAAIGKNQEVASFSLCLAQNNYCCCRLVLTHVYINDNLITVSFFFSIRSQVQRVPDLYSKSLVLWE